MDTSSDTTPPTFTGSGSPHKGIVISTRDVIFDERTFFDDKRTDLSDELIAELDTLIEKVKLPETQAKNEALLEEDEEILEPAATDEVESDDEPIQDFNENEDLELAKALEDAYLTPPPSDEDEDSPRAFHVQYRMEDTDIDQEHNEQQEMCSKTQMTRSKNRSPQPFIELL